MYSCYIYCYGGDETFIKFVNSNFNICNLKTDIYIYIINFSKVNTFAKENFVNFKVDFYFYIKGMLKKNMLQGKKILLNIENLKRYLLFQFIKFVKKN